MDLDAPRSHPVANGNTSINHGESDIDQRQTSRLTVPSKAVRNGYIKPLNHMLLVLSDSALPLGSFAFSSGLESFIAHRRPKIVGAAELQHFLSLSIASLASTSLPYVLAAHRQPQDILQLDNEFDASTLCQVARRASIAQGRALIGVWERSIAMSIESSASTIASHQALKSIGDAIRGPKPTCNWSGTSGHFPPLWGVVCNAASIPLSTTAYLYLFKHAQAVLSAAVRASTVGPYQAQAILASKWLEDEIDFALTTEWETNVEDAAQVAPIMDLWIALHEKLYSKIFSS